MNNPMIPNNVRPLALQAILYFVLAKMAGKTRLDATHEFIDSDLCKAFGDKLTFGNVDGLSEAAGGYTNTNGSIYP